MTPEKSQVMQHGSHSRTLIAVLRDAVDAWRRSNGWSRETVAQVIVEMHERIGASETTGIKFSPPSSDTFERAKANADRIFRWLDDSSKDNNLLPSNFVLSILAALPADRRLHLADELLSPVGLRAIYADDDADDATAHNVALHFQAVVEHSAAANVAMSKMLDGIDPGEPEQAKKKLSIASATMQRALGLMNRILRRKGKKS